MSKVVRGRGTYLPVLVLTGVVGLLLLLQPTAVPRANTTTAIARIFFMEKLSRLGCESEHTEGLSIARSPDGSESTGNHERVEPCSPAGRGNHESWSVAGFRGL